MSLRGKTLAFVVLSVAALVGATLWVIDGLVMRELAQVEREETARKVADVRSVVQRCMKEYGDRFSDWTDWDDMAQFLADGNRAFLDSNVSLASLADQIHADFFVVERNDGTIVHATQVDAARSALEPCASAFLAHVTPHGLMRPGNSYAGLLAFRDSTYIVSSRPIHKSNGADGPVQGRLVSAERLNDAWIQRLEGFTFLELRFTRTSETPLEEEELTAREALAAGADSFVAETGPDHISGYGLLQDIYGKPALVLQVSRGRSVSMHGQEIVSWAMLTLVSGGLVLCLLSMWAVGQGALRPLQRLLGGTHKLQRGERTHVIVRSGDEFQELAHDFNQMSDAIFEREEALKSTHQELARLLDGMGEAIVAFGPDGTVTGAASRKAHEVFGRGVLAGVSLRDLLYPGTDEFDIEAEAFQAWLTVAFTQPVEAWEQVRELAPRQVVLRSGAPDETHLALEFRAIVIEGQIQRVILLATDATEKHRLLQRQAERESAHERQLRAMRKLLAGGAQVFVDFVRSSRERLDEVASVLLERPEQLDATDVELLFRHAHTLEGEARVFDIEKLEQSCRALEELLCELRTEARAGKAGAGARLPRMRELLAAARGALEQAQELFVRASPIGEAILDQMAVRRSDVQALDELTLRLAQPGAGPLVWALRDIVERLHSRPFGELCSAFVERVPLWAEKLGKRGRLEIEGREVPIPPALAQRLPGALTHLLRNAVSHGIETPELREERHKDAAGKVRLVATLDGQGPQIRVEDDGAGLDLAGLAARARALGHPVVEGEEWRLVFVAGLSTAGVSDEYSGRGVGMGAVQAELAQAGYDVELESLAQQCTRVTLRRKFCALDGAHEQQQSAREKPA
jgi:sensor domain CHASE-containing protein/HPt (histidine-containing phosphotransfer) domain-containing protein